MNLTKLAEGIYTEEDGTLHLDLPELCIAAGVEPTVENQEQLEGAALLMFDGPIEVQEHNDGGRGTWRE